MIDVKSLQRAFDILDLYATKSFELGVSEVAQKLDMNKSTVSRLMANMESAGYLSKSPLGRKYRLGKKVVRLANVFFSNVDLKSIVMPYLINLNEITKEMVGVHAIEGDQRRNLAWVESSHPVRRVMGPEYIMSPLHAGAPGKLLLAFLPDEKIHEIISRTGLPGYTSNTITDKAQLFREIKKIREEGIAVSKGEHVELLSTVAVPIRNYIGHVIAALGISWVSRPNDSDIQQKYTDLIMNNAREISQELGYFGQVEK